MQNRVTSAISSHVARCNVRAFVKARAMSTSCRWARVASASCTLANWPWVESSATFAFAFVGSATPRAAAARARW